MKHIWSEEGNKVKKNSKRYTVACPNCGRKPISAAAADDAEIYCQKCRKKYEIEITERSLQVREVGAEYVVTGA